MVDILWNERNVATRMVKRGCIVKRAPSIKKKKQEGISFEKSLLSVATGEHCLVCSIYYTYIYIYISRNWFWIAALEERETGNFRSPRRRVKVSGSGESGFFFSSFFFYNLSNSFQGEPEIRFMRYVDT